MISWLGEKMRHWAEEKAKADEAMRRVVWEYIMVGDEIKKVASDDPDYPPDLYPRLKMTTMCGDAYNTGEGDGVTPIPFPKGRDQSERGLDPPMVPGYGLPSDHYGPPVELPDGSFRPRQASDPK